TVRLADASDNELLKAFRCSTGPWYEDKVEEFIVARSLARALEGRLGFKLLLFENEAEGLVAVGAHHWRAYEVEDIPTDGTYMVVAAIAVPFQGKSIQAGQRLSSYLMNALLSDADGQGRGDIVTALVARDNTRSLALCRRFGIQDEIPSPDP